jgi:hypothetical protein
VRDTGPFALSTAHIRPSRLQHFLDDVQRWCLSAAVPEPDAILVESGRPCRLPGPLPLMQRARFSRQSPFPTSQSYTQSPLLHPPPPHRRRRLLRPRQRQKQPPNAGRSRTASSASACAACTLRRPLAPRDPRPRASGTRRTVRRARRLVSLAASNRPTTSRHAPSRRTASPTSLSSAPAVSATSIRS